MGFDIPEPYKWDESFKVFYEKLDDEHRGLFDGIFKLCSPDTNNADNLSALVNNVKAHFATEEGMMKASPTYGKYDEHKKLHDEFVAKCGAASAPCAQGTVDFLKEWLVNHIKGVDFGYKDKL